MGRKRASNVWQVADWLLHAVLLLILAGHRTASFELYQTFTCDFNHGVASGDPTDDAIILWTRATPRPFVFSRSNHPRGTGNSRTLQVFWRVFLEDEHRGTTQTLREGVFRTGPERDYTVKVDLTGRSQQHALPALAMRTMFVQAMPLRRRCACSSSQRS
eukprot:scaffold55_cov401-Prasinococcus_capsulatus_cf.AAC.15